MGEGARAGRRLVWAERTLVSMAPPLTTTVRVLNDSVRADPFFLLACGVDIGINGRTLTGWACMGMDTHTHVHSAWTHLVFSCFHPPRTAVSPAHHAESVARLVAELTRNRRFPAREGRGLDHCKPVQHVVAPLSAAYLSPRRLALGLGAHP